MLKGFEELFTSYSGSSEKHARGVYFLTSYYHTPKNDNFNVPFVVKIGMSFNMYNRMGNYQLYYPEGFWALGFAFLPLTCDVEDVKTLEATIQHHPALWKHVYANEWYKVPNLKYLWKEVRVVLKKFPNAILIDDLSKRISLSNKYIPQRLKDKKVIDKIAKEYAEEKTQSKKLQEAKEKETKKGVISKSDKGPAYNTRFHNIKNYG